MNEIKALESELLPSWSCRYYQLENGECAIVLGDFSLAVLFKSEAEVRAYLLQMAEQRKRSNLDSVLQSTPGGVDKAFAASYPMIAKIIDFDHMMEVYAELGQKADFGKRELRFLLICFLVGNSVRKAFANPRWVYWSDVDAKLLGLGLRNNNDLLDVSKAVIRYCRSSDFEFRSREVQEFIGLSKIGTWYAISSGARDNFQEI